MFNANKHEINIVSGNMLIMAFIAPIKDGNNFFCFSYSHVENREWESNFATARLNSLEINYVFKLVNTVNK